MAKLDLVRVDGREVDLQGFVLMTSGGKIYGTKAFQVSVELAEPVRVKDMNYEILDLVVLAANYQSDVGEDVRWTISDVKLIDVESKYFLDFSLSNLPKSLERELKLLLKDHLAM